MVENPIRTPTTIQDLLQQRGREGAPLPIVPEVGPPLAPPADGGPPATIGDLLRRGGLDPEEFARRQRARRAAGTFTRPEKIQTLRGLGVDVETGGPAGLRAQLAITPQERRRTVIEEAFPLGFVETDVGLVVNTPGGQLLLDEEGLSFGDLADVTGEGIIAVGALGAAVVAIAAAPALVTGGVLSLALLAVITGVSGQAGLTVAEVIAAYKAGGIDLDDPADRELLTNIVKRRGVAAAVDSGLDFISAGAFRLAKGAVQRIAAPNIGVLERTPTKEILEAADRLDVPLSPGEQIGGGILRAEALAERIPAAAEPVRVLRRATAGAVGRVEEELVGRARPGAEVGAGIVASLEARRVASLEEIEDLRRRAGAKIERKLGDVARAMSRTRLSLNEAGEAVRTRVQSRLLKFKDRQSRLEAKLDGAIAEIQKDERAFLSTAALQRLAFRLEEEFPKREIIEEVTRLDPSAPGGISVVEEVIGRETIPELFPAAARSILKGIQKLPGTITVGELRNIRQTINSMIDNAAGFRGVSTGMLKSVEKELTVALRGGIKSAPTPKIGAALEKALTHFREGSPKFRDVDVARVLRDPSQQGFVEGVEVLPALILNNKVEAAKRIVKVAGLGSPEVHAAKTSVFDDMLQRSQDTLLGDGFIDPKKLARQIDTLSPTTKAFLFGGDVMKVRLAVRLLAARHGIVKIADIAEAPTERTILSLLRQASKQEAEAARLFDTKVLKPFLAGASGAGAPNPGDFIRFALKKASPEELTQLFKLLSRRQRLDFESTTVVHIIERSAIAGADPEAQAVALLTGRGGVGLKLAKVLAQDFGATVAESLAKLRVILPTDTLRILEDLALVQAARGQAMASGKAVGGLVAGSVISGFLDLRIGTAVRLVKARIAARMMRSKPVRAWLTSRIKFKPLRKDVAAFQLALPQILRAITQEVGEVSPEAQALSDFFMRDVPEQLGLNPKPQTVTGEEPTRVEDVSRMR